MPHRQENRPEHTDAFEKMRDDYYYRMGWNEQTGIPANRKLKGLGIQKESSQLDLLNCECRKEKISEIEKR